LIDNEHFFWGAVKKEMGCSHEQRAGFIETLNSSFHDTEIFYINGASHGDTVTYGFICVKFLGIHAAQLKLSVSALLCYQNRTVKILGIYDKELCK